MPSLVLAFATLAAAGPTPSTPLPGLWEGRIGTLPVRACFGRRGSGEFGGYYYGSQLKHIALEPVEGEPATFAEPYSPGKPRWRIDEASASEIRGSWTSGRRRLQIRLARSGTGTCDSIAFHAPRLAGIRIATSRATKDGLGYRRLVLDSRGRFEASVETFALDGASAAVGRVNARLREPFDQWFDCVRAPLERSAYEGSFHATLAPALITGRWLSVVHQQDHFCGGAYPNAGRTYRTFDLATGRETDLHDWFNARAVSLAGTARTEPETRRLEPEFRRFLLAGRRGEEADCDEVVSNAEYWNIGLTAEGMVFAPQLAHAVQACGFELTYPAGPLAPFLSRQGAANLREIETERSR